MKTFTLDRPKDWNRFRPIFLKIGFVQSIVLCLAFLQVEATRKTFALGNTAELEKITLVVPPRIPSKPKPKVVPPLPPKIKPTLPLLIEPIEKTQYEEKTEEVFREPDEPVNFIEVDSSAFVPTETPPIIEPEKSPNTDEIVDFPERMPIFGECLSVEESEMRKCSDQQLLSYIYNELKYPSLARENGIEGMVVIQFIVGKDGAVRDVEVLRAIGGGCEIESTRVIKKLPKWTPGKQNGRPVSVRYTIPIRFELK